MVLPNPELDVSVIIPVLNEENNIKMCLDSLASQTYPSEKMEWIVIDGGSKDGTLEILDTYRGDHPLRLLKNNNKGTPASLNLGILNSKGRYILRMDAHSVYPKNYIEKCVYYLENTDSDNVGGRIETTADGLMGEAIASVLSSRFGVGSSFFRVGGKSGYVDTVPYGAFRRDVFEKVGLFNEELLRSEDNDLNSRILKSGGKIYLAEDIVSEYRCRDTVRDLIVYALKNGNALLRTVLRNPSAMRIRHFVPLLFVFSLIALSLLSIKYDLFRLVLIFEILVYILVDLFYSFRDRDWLHGRYRVWLYPLFHISYGIGSLLGVIGVKLY